MRNASSLSALLAVFALSTPAGADGLARALYAEGFWDGYAAARAVVAAHRRHARGAIGLTTAEPAAPVWTLSAAAEAFELPPSYAVPAGARIVYFRGPWLWVAREGSPELGTRVPHRDFAEGDGLDLADAAAIEEGVALRIREMRRMGLNEGLVIAAPAPVN